MPNSENHLCGYHLVTKGLESLRPKLLDWEKDNVKDQIATFKHWLFSLMKIDGIETEQQFLDFHYYLRKWLRNQQTSADKSIQHNS